MKGGATYQDIKSNTVIKDPHTVSGMRWDDTDISGMQSVFDPLYRSVGSSVIQTENLKKFMFMGKNRGIAVMLGKHDIAIYIMSKSGMDYSGGSSQRRRRSRNTGSSGGTETGKRNGFSVYEPSFCGSTSDVRKKRPGNGIYEILLGRNVKPRCGYILGAL